MPASRSPRQKDLLGLRGVPREQIDLARVRQAAGQGSSAPGSQPQVAAWWWLESSPQSPFPPQPLSVNARPKKLLTGRHELPEALLCCRPVCQHCLCRGRARLVRVVGNGPAQLLLARGGDHTMYGHNLRVDLRWV